jgi:hypothetical protein
MFDFDLAEVVGSGDLRQRRNDGKIDAAGEGLPAGLANFPVRFLHVLLAFLLNSAPPTWPNLARRRAAESLALSAGCDFDGGK